MVHRNRTARPLVLTYNDELDPARGAAAIADLLAHLMNTLGAAATIMPEWISRRNAKPAVDKRTTIDLCIRNSMAPRSGPFGGARRVGRFGGQT